MSFTSQELIIVSNRLPITVSKEGKKLRFKESSGGLATGLASINKISKGTWIGWPGISSDELTVRDRQKISTELKKHNCRPVFLTQDQIDNFYSGYSNETLWPLFHYTHDRAKYSEDYWQTYKQVNEIFADEVSKAAHEDSLVWIHDYHLALVPASLRKHMPQTKIGFFLHTPFPSYELFRLLPERKQILEGLLGADLIGFHTYDYARHFMSSVLRVLGYESVGSEVHLPERFVKTEVFPIGIDYQKLAKAVANKSIKDKIREIRNSNSPAKVLLSFDRADYSKGIPERLDSYEYFLEHHPEQHGKITMLLIVAPSRVDVEAYQQLQEEINIRISQINGQYSTVEWSPISYMHRDFDFEEVVATYCLADIMLVTPLRDGMNVMAKEFVAIKQNKQGVLILSEMAGAASELLEAIVVNPNDKHMVADAIVAALNMPKREQRQRLNSMQKRISDYTIYRWAEDFVNELTRTTNSQLGDTQEISALIRRQILSSYAAAKKRLILLDYDGTLRTFVSNPDPSMASPAKHVISALRTLSQQANNTVVIISGRPKAALTQWFKNVPVGLVAEHGAWVRNLTRWIRNKTPEPKWKAAVQPILQSFNDRTPGSVVEFKDFAFVWHYRNVAPGLAYVRNQELIKELESALNGMSKSVGIFEGNKIFEIKPRSLQKGEVVQRLMQDQEYDFILAMGDDYTDEDMFQALPDTAITIKVGSGITDAHYQIASVEQAQKLVTDLSKAD